MVSEDEERDGEGTRRRREEPEEVLRDVIYVQVRISRLMLSPAYVYFSSHNNVTFPPRRALTEGKDHTEEKDLREGKALIAAVRAVGKLS